MGHLDPISKDCYHKNIWYLDNNCNNHITRDKEAFVAINSSFVSKVKLGNVGYVEVEGKCNIIVTTKQKG
ncbi:hypothetical protein CR513_04263, partial [Mucuna pruriens]